MDQLWGSHGEQAGVQWGESHLRTNQGIFVEMLRMLQAGESPAHEAIFPSDPEPCRKVRTKGPFYSSEASTKRREGEGVVAQW